MDLEKIEARNDCAGKGQQQFNWPNNQVAVAAKNVRSIEATS
jgi:hypothetical protein